VHRSGQVQELHDGNIIVTGFDLKGAKNALIALLDDTPGLQAIFDGAPESMPTRTAAWVLVGDLIGPAASVASGGLYELTAHMIVTIGFVLEGAEDIAEDNVADAITEITRRVLQNRTQTVSGVAPLLGGTVKTMEPPGPAAMPSDYVTIAGQAARLYPMAIEIKQRETISPS
jgi:hypothetical protein